MSERKKEQQELLFLHSGSSLSKKEGAAKLSPSPSSSEEEKIRSANDSLIGEIYFDPKHPAGFGGPQKLYNAVKKEHPAITYSHVHSWLSKQPVYTLHREVITRFARRKTIVRGPFIQYQADLLDVQNISQDNDRFRYILTVIDCFSRKAAAIPILQKKGPVVSEALQQAFSMMGGAPLKLQTDQGTEFLNKHVKEMLQSLGTVLFNTYQDVKAAIIERFNRTLRTRIQKYMAHVQSLRFIDQLPNFIESYNNSVHRALKYFTPNQVSVANAPEVFEIQYRPYLLKRAKKRKFKIGDVVRITTFRPKFFKKNMQKNFTVELFRIVSTLDTYPPTYQLVADSDSESIEGAFYESELQKVLQQ